MASKNIILPISRLEKEESLLNILENNKKLFQNTNSTIKKIYKTFYILKRGILNNLGKIFTFTILIILLLILLIEFEIPIDGSYIENSTKFQRFLTLINIIFISIIVAGTISIFNVENLITKDHEENKDQLYCKYKGLLELLDYKYILQPIEEHNDIKEIIEYDSKYKILFKENLLDNELKEYTELMNKMNKMNLIFENENISLENNISEDHNLKIIKYILYEKLILNYLLDNITNNITTFAILKKIKELMEKIDMENYTNIHIIKDETIININKLLKNINNEKNLITVDKIIQYYDDQIKNIEKYYNREDENKIKIKSSEIYKLIKDKSVRNKNLYTYNFFKSNKYPLYKPEFKAFIKNLDKDFIKKIYNKLEDTCKSLSRCLN